MPDECSPELAERIAERMTEWSVACVRDQALPSLLFAEGERDGEIHVYVYLQGAGDHERLRQLLSTALKNLPES